MSRRRRRPQRDIRKGAYILPNLFTTASLFSGFYAVISAINHQFFDASVAILISGVFDFLDGKIARLTGTTSQFGVEYDSLADLVAFGVAPGVLAYQWALEPFGRLGWAAGFLYVACGALRLARFNVTTSRSSGNYFQGLPIPAAAAMIATTVFLFHYLGQTGTIKHVAVMMLIYALSFLMVSNMRYFSFKNVEFIHGHRFNALVIAVLFLSLIAVEPQVVLFICMLAFIISGPVLTFVEYRARRTDEASDKVEREAEG